MKELVVVKEWAICAALKRFPRIRSASFELTNDCNMNCDYCYRKNRLVGYMDFEEFKKVFSQLPDTCQLICLSYAGESGLHPRMNDFVLMVKSRKIIPVIYSNGTLVYPPGITVIKLPKPPRTIITPDLRFKEDYNLPPVYQCCYELYGAINVLWNGDVVPCCRDLGGTHIMGNVFRESVANVWNGEKYHHAREAGHCESCEVWPYDLTF